MLRQYRRPNRVSLLSTVHIHISEECQAIYSLRLKKLKSIKLRMNCKYFLVWNNKCLVQRGVYMGIPQYSHLKLHYSLLLEGLRFHRETGENFRKTAYFWLGFPPPREVSLCVRAKQVRIYPSLLPSFHCWTVNQNCKLHTGLVIPGEVPGWNLQTQV